MSNQLGAMTLEDAATEAAGNWKRFNCFCWFRDDIDDRDQWAIIYTHNRDSGLLDQSNAAAISKAMQPFSDTDSPDVVFESHNHWAVGHVDGFSIRVFQCGEITAAFKAYHELAEAEDNYPILDEADYSNREFEATVANLKDAAWRLKDDFELPDDWQYQVYDYLSQNKSGEVENRDDQGGYPSEQALEAAFNALGFEQTASAC